jgi:hypothetical protein
LNREIFLGLDMAGRLSPRSSSNEKHQSKMDLESELARKGPGQPSCLAFSGALKENRHGLLVELEIARQGPAAVARDRGCHVRSFAEGCRTLGIMPPVAR